MKVLTRTLKAALMVLLFAIACMAAKQFVMPRPQAALEYVAHDSHPMEKVTIAADPYDTKDKEDKVLVGDYLQHGFLPVFLVISNEGDRPVALTRIKLELLTRDKAKAAPATDDDLYRRFTNTTRFQNKSSGSRRLPYPIPLPKGDQGAVKKELREEFDASKFYAKAVEPHGTQAGFVYFDISGLPDPARGATLTVTGVRDGDGNELMYFEIPLDKYVNAKPAPSDR